MVSRRQTLVTGAGAGAGATLGAVLGTVLGPARCAAGPAGADPLTRAAFAPLVGAALTLAGRDGRHTVTLVGAPGRDDTFSLRFATAGPVPEGIYRVDHPDLAPVDLFLSPVGPTAGRIDAVVNRSHA